MALEYALKLTFFKGIFKFMINTTGHPGSVTVPRYSFSKITVFVWGKNTILKVVGNTKRSIRLTLQLVVVILSSLTNFLDNLLKLMHPPYSIIHKVGGTRCQVSRPQCSLSNTSFCSKFELQR